MKMTATDDSERFRTGAAKYAAYLETPEGQLRLDLAFANLRDFLPLNTRSLQALDIGGGIGANTVRLAQLGIHVTLLDSSAEMLNIAENAARGSGLSPEQTECMCVWAVPQCGVVLRPRQAWQKPTRRS